MLLIVEYVPDNLSTVTVIIVIVLLEKVSIIYLNLFFMEICPTDQ
jgi:hypothetical protein